MIRIFIRERKTNIKTEQIHFSYGNMSERKSGNGLEKFGKIRSTVVKIDRKVRKVPRNATIHTFPVYAHLQLYRIITQFNFHWLIYLYKYNWNIIWIAEFLINSVRKFVLNLTRFTCPKRFTQIIMLIWYKMNMLESSKHYVKINTKKCNILTQFVETYFFSKINIYNTLN